MIDLSQQAQHVLLHTLGLNYGDNDYRNRFIASDGHADMPHLAELVEAGLMAERTAPAFCSGDDRLFMATDRGRSVAFRIKRENAPKLTRSQARYRRYLECADCFENFRQFLHYEMEHGVEA